MRLTQKVGASTFEEKRPTRSTRSLPQREQSEIEKDFLELMDKWHGHKELWDDALDILILSNELAVRTTHKPRLDWGPKGTKYLSPSSANSDARELYLKLLKFPRDEQATPPHQGRWRRLGTLFGDTLQRDLLFIEKHYKKEFGVHPAFKPEYIEVPSVADPKDTRLFPMWENFAQKIVWVQHRGHNIPILGKPDGILRHLPSGKRVGLEVKSKQTTAAQTTPFTMRSEKVDHYKQCVNYSIMYSTPEAPLEDFIIVYGNLSKKAWYMTEEEYKKNPDIRGFHVKVTEKDRLELLDYYADILDAIDTGHPPKLDLEKWTFNNFKTASAQSLTSDELEVVRQEAAAMINSGLPEWQKKGYREAIEFIEEVRSK
jgi:hypothetical protein